MRSEMVEIFSDQTNAAVMRHPGRAFPGVLVREIASISSASRPTWPATKWGEARLAMMK
jgi:hypothetical protein